MAKWADYLISAVSYTETTTTKHISKVKVHIDNGEDVGASSIWSRAEVVDAIDKGKSFCTMTSGSDGKWKKGALVEKVWIFNAWYIKTQKDNTQKDNLGELPEF